ncbi:hypothetical protein ACXGQW_04880 [Wenyingzhuangia sp. IMCC45533]
MKIKRLLQNNKILALTFFVMIMIVYQLSLVKSWNLYCEKKTLKEELFANQKAIAQLSLIQQKKIAYDSILSELEIHNNLNLSNYIFEKIQTICDENKVKISSYQKPHKLQISDKNLQTSYIFKLNGQFKNTLKSINEIEIQSLGSIVHLNFEKVKNYRTDKNELNCDVILRVIE